MKRTGGDKQALRQHIDSLTEANKKLKEENNFLKRQSK